MPKVALNEAHAILAADMGGLSHDPVGYAKYSYPWGPRVWQAKILDAIGSHLRSPERYTPLQIAVASGHGIGKSALVAMIIGWGMSTCEDCNIVLTANTFDQLRTKTWPEVGKWLKESATFKAGWWNSTATSITFAGGKRPKWRADAVAWSEENTESFQGLHNQGKRIVLIFDEASAIADKVWEVAEGALTDSDTEIIWLAFGNPTRTEGRFKECFGKFRARWKCFQIDSRTVEGTNKEQIAKQVEDYGEDSDFIRVRVRGEFPRAGSSQFIPSDIVERARQYRASNYQSQPKILSVDVARYGDDQTVIGTRQGRHSKILSRLRGLDNVEVAQRVIEIKEKEKPDAVIVDGDGLGSGVVDYLKHTGHSLRLFEFHGGNSPLDHKAYYNKRAECWGLMRDWLKDGAEIPDEPEMATDLCAPQYGFSSKNQIQLEKKEDMKKRGEASPDAGDMLAMTFAVKVTVRPQVFAPVMSYGQSGWML